jgi:hypothetical protein
MSGNPASIEHAHSLTWGRAHGCGCHEFSKEVLATQQEMARRMPAPVLERGSASLLRPASES